MSAAGGRTTSVLLRRLIWATALLIYGLIVFGGIVRVTSSGLGCPDWPLCHGHIIPPWDLAAWLEWGHRLVASVVGLFLIASTAVAWSQLTISHPVTRYLALTIPLLLIESGLGGLAVIRELPSEVIMLHLAMSLATLALVILAAVRAERPHLSRVPSPSARSIRRMVILTYLFILTGALVTGTGAAWVCPDWPLCQGSVLPGPGILAWINVIHRFFTAFVGVALVGLALRVRRDTTLDPRARMWVYAALGFFLLGALVGALTVLSRFHAAINASHLAVAAAMWASLVLAMAQAYVVEGAAEEAPSRQRKAREAQARSPGWRAYVGLMKPGIVALLVVTTVGGMIIAARGWPGWGLFFWTVVGSILSAGGANAINSYYDRDIDGLMARTARRPLPQGKIPPRRALTFALTLILAGVVILGVFVNTLVAVISLVGAFWYTVIYTRWLKRRTPQNIVIGGAAGAFAPVVGWAAATGRVDFLALVLFALIFLWTPPHTWAFAILTLRDYERVNIPMLPVVAGLDVTTRQVILYSWLMALVTLLPVALGLLGSTYFLGMVVLNLIFLYLAHLLRKHPDKHIANRLYQYSNAYLYLTFALMAFDRMGGLLN